MKYKTFRKLVILGVLVVGGVTIYSMRPQPTYSGPGALRKLDRKVIDRIEQGISGSKAKDGGGDSRRQKLSPQPV